MHDHGVARRGDGHGLLPGVNKHRRQPRFERHNRGIDLADGRLLRAEAAADARLDDAHAALGNIKRCRHNAADVEGNLRRSDDLEPAVIVHLRERAKCLHHALLIGARRIDAVDDDVAFCKLRLDIPVRLHAVGDEISAVVRAAVRHECAPVRLGMQNGLVVHRLLRVKHGGQDLIGHADEPHGRQSLPLRLRRDDRNRIADTAQMPVENQPVVGAELRIGLPRQRKAPVRHILPGQHAGDTRQRPGAADVD